MDTLIAGFPSKSIVILIVDDDPDNLVLLNYQVSLLFQCSVLTASDGQTALAMAKQFAPNLILMDMMLPDTDGCEIVRRLKQDLQTRSILVVAVSAMARSTDRDRALLAGCSDYVRKPYELEVLEAAINRCFGAQPITDSPRLTELLDAS